MARKAKETTKETDVKTKESAAKVKEAAVETAAKAKEAIAGTAAKAKEIVAETAVKVKEVPAKTKEATKSASKKSSKDSCFVEFSNKQFSTEEIVENAKLNWKSTHEGSISEIKVYVNVDESKVYYVVNGTDAGNFQI